MITRYDQIIIDGRHWENRAEDVTRGSLYMQYAAGIVFLYIFSLSLISRVFGQVRSPGKTFSNIEILLALAITSITQPRIKSPMSSHTP